MNGTRMSCIGVLVVLFGIMGACNVSNVETPAGYVGYVTEGAIFGGTHFAGLQSGPTSTGLAWKRSVINVSVTPNNTDEFFEDDPSGHKEGVVAKDNLKIQYVVHVVWQVDPNDVRSFVEDFTHMLHATSDAESKADQAAKIDTALRIAYDNNLKPAIRAFAREEVAKNDGLDIQSHMGSTGEEIKRRAKEYVKGTPFRILSINLGNPQPPETVLNAMKERAKKQFDLQQALTDAQIADKDRQKAVADARGTARAMAELSSKLTDEYLEYEAVEANRAMVKSPRHTVVYLPQGSPAMINLQKPQ